MHKPKQLMDFDENWEAGTAGGMVDLYKKIPGEFIAEYNNLVEVVNYLWEWNQDLNKELIDLQEE